jgi:hypothetical protein
MATDSVYNIWMLGVCGELGCQCAANCLAHIAGGEAHFCHNQLPSS